MITPRILAQGTFKPEDHWRKGAYVGAFVKTSDDYYVLVSLSGRSMNTNKLGLPGGTLDVDVPVTTGDDIYETMYKELEEETSIPRDHISSAVLKTVILTPNTLVNFHFEISVTDSKDEIQKRFDVECEDGDIASLIFVPVADMSAQLLTMSDMMRLLREMYFPQVIVR